MSCSSKWKQTYSGFNITLRSSTVYHAYSGCVKLAGGLPQSMLTGLRCGVSSAEVFSEIQPQNYKVCLQDQGSIALTSGCLDDSVGPVQLDRWLFFSETPTLTFVHFSLHWTGPGRCGTEILRISWQTHRHFQTFCHKDQFTILLYDL